MATELDTKTNIVDSALGPVTIVESNHAGFDVDDFVSTTVESQATHLKLVTIAQSVKSSAVKGRPPVNLEGTVLGGFNG